MMAATRYILTLVLFLVTCFSSLGISGCSPDDSLPAYDTLMVLFGDPHVHTCLSDGDESPDYALRYARDVTKLDWCVLTDHSEWMDESVYEYYRTVPQKYDDPGNFCVFFGWEYTDFPENNHRNLYSLESDLPILPSNQAISDTPSLLYEALSAYDVISVPHHPMTQSREPWWVHHNEEIETSVEIYSKWGLSLHIENERSLYNANGTNAIYNALSVEQLQYGFLAGSDTHISRPGSNLREQRRPLIYSKSGLTAVWAPEFTSEAIFEAIKNGRTYAVTGTRVLLEFTVNDSPMGDEIISDTAPMIEFQVTSQVPLTRVGIYRITDQEVLLLRSYSTNTLVFSGSHVDDSFSGSAGYFLWVDLENTDMAICSPVFVDVPVEESNESDLL